MSIRLDSVNRFLVRLSCLILPYRSAHRIDLQIAELAPSLLSANTFFLEVGANDGLSLSNTYFLEAIYGARGILIEPSPLEYSKLISNRSSNNLFFNCALVSSGYGKSYIDLEYSGLMTFCSSTSENTVDRSVQLANGSKYTKIKHFKFTSRAVKLGSLLKDSNIAVIDLISIDIEGMEIKALETIDFANILVKYILVESFSPQSLMPRSCAPTSGAVNCPN